VADRHLAGIGFGNESDVPAMAPAVDFHF